MPMKKILIASCKRGHVINFNNAFEEGGSRDGEGKRTVRCPTPGCEEVVHEKKGVRLDVEEQ